MRTKIRILQNNADIFFYLGMILITLSGWKYGWFGIQRYNPPSEVLFIIYLLIRFGEKSIKLKRDIIEELLLVAIMLVYSGSVIVTRGYEVSKFINGINIFGWYYCCFLAINTYLSNADKEKIKTMLICIKNSFYIAIVVGLIQAINIYIHTFGWYEGFIDLFTLNHNAILTRVRFTFSEPSEAATYICFLYIPVMLLLKQLNYKFKKMDIVQMALLGILSLMTMAISYFSVLLIVFLCYLLSGKSKIKALLVIILLVGVYIIMIRAGLFDRLITNTRIRLLFTDPMVMLAADYSIRTRICYYFVTWHAIKERFLLGYGWNYFFIAMKDAQSLIPTSIITSEYTYKLQHADNFVSYEALFSILTCGGLVGALWFIKVIKTRFIRSVKVLQPFVVAYLISLLLGQGLLKSIPIIVFMELCANKQIIKACKETL